LLVLCGRYGNKWIMFFWRLPGFCLWWNHFIDRMKKWQKTKERIVNPTRAPQNTVWQKSPTWSLKCNVEVLFSRSCNKVDIGVCIWDGHGQFVLANTHRGGYHCFLMLILEKRWDSSTLLIGLETYTLSVTFELYYFKRV
jgi:hypothetical protein